MGDRPMPRGAYDVMDLKSLRCFFAVARHNSLTRAGIELGISEAAVSQRVRALESYLGTKLYESRGGRVQLTVAGERTGQLAVSIFGEIEALESAVTGAEDTAEITLSSHDSVLRFLLPDRIEAFSRAHPLARLRLVARPVGETLLLVRANECDLGVIPRRPASDDLNFTEIATYPHCLVFQKGHALARRARADFRSLPGDGTAGRYPLVMLEVQREDTRLAQAFAEHGLPFNVGLEVSTVDTLKHYVARGLGIGIVSGVTITREDHARLDVVEIPAELGGTTNYGVTLRRDKHRTALLKSLLTVLTAAEPN